jgi:hypothetical protein
MDEPMQALEWVKWGLGEINTSLVEYLTTYDFPAFVLAAVRPLIQLNQLEGVLTILDETHKNVLTRGDDHIHFNHQFVSGLYELAVGNLEVGVQDLAETLKEAERLNYQTDVNSILLELTKSEVKNYTVLETGTTTDSSGHWMTRLEIHSREKNYPGIMMQHALLKAEYQKMIGETEAAQLTLQDALTFTDSPGVMTLRERILERLEELSSVNA